MGSALSRRRYLRRRIILATVGSLLPSQEVTKKIMKMARMIRKTTPKNQTARNLTLALKRVKRLELEALETFIELGIR